MGRLAALPLAVLTFLGLLIGLPQPAVAGPATAGTVYYWNDVLLGAIRLEGGGPGPISRSAAMMHAGLFDALNSAVASKAPGHRPAYRQYLTLKIVDRSVDQDLAAGFTAHDLLVDAMPAQRAYIDQKFAERHGSSFQLPARQLADAVVGNVRAARANDGSNATMSYTPDGVAGSWRPTDGCTAITSDWGAVRPFALSSGSQFRRPGPGGFTSYSSLLASSAYAAKLAEVRILGRYNSSVRTADQTRAAWFWANDLDGTYKPPGQLLTMTRTVTQPRYSDPVQVSRVFTLVSLSMADAAIAAWDMKYRTSVDLWRPETAIKLASSNPDPSWEPLSADRNNVSFSPCFPAWVSGHATLAGAWAGVMRSEFGDNVTFTGTTEDPHAVGVTRTFTSFTSAAAEDARSRIYLGVHFQFDADDGNAAGYDIANYVVPRYLTRI
jgi:hypothetical protein